MNTQQALGRLEWALPIDEPLEKLAEERILVTGAAGSVGTALVEALETSEAEVLATDRETLDVTNTVACWHVENRYKPSIVFHLAAHKSAPEGELDPDACQKTNITGTRTVIREFPHARVITASTCKACDPETVYGASKLIAERLTLNAGGSVARFHNIVESQGNVFRLWETLPDPVPVTPCSRFLISMREAVALTLWAAVLEPGRYSVWPIRRRWMAEVAHDLGRAHYSIPPRRGDRAVEPPYAHNEQATTIVDGIAQIVGTHDPVREELAVA